MVDKIVGRMACAILIAFALAVETGQAADLKSEFMQRAASIEDRIGGRIGVAVHDLGGNEILSYQPDQRFPMSSTFKALLCGAVLARIDAGQESPDRIISYAPDEIVTYSPITEHHAEAGMTVAALCQATMTLSDNTAGNLLLATVGGPDGLTQFLRALGDQTTRLDRWETDLNEGAPGDPRDTTTPQAILTSLNTLAFQGRLTPASQNQLRQWMIDDKVADGLLRSVLPADWKIGDKTGAGGHGARSIVAVVWPPEAKPILIAVYLAGNNKPMEVRNAAIVEIGATIFELLQSR